MELESLKQQGNEAYGKGEHALAIQRYSEAIDGLRRRLTQGANGDVEQKSDRSIAGPSSAHEQQVRQLNELLAVCLTNRAASSLALPSPPFGSVVQDCTEALKLSPGNAKALLRRAKAYESMATLSPAVSASPSSSNQSPPATMDQQAQHLELAAQDIMIVLRAAGSQQQAIIKEAGAMLTRIKESVSIFLYLNAIDAQSKWVS